MSAAHEGLRLGLLATATGLGFRHGIDWDHIAAITDLTAAQDSPRAAMASSTCYFVGHGLVVGGLGAAAIVAGQHVPASIDRVMEKVVGATLLALGVYVLVSLIRNGRAFRMRSRWMLVFAGVRRLAGRRHRHRYQIAERTTITEGGFFGSSGPMTSVAVGALHGIGAETPTQVLLLTAAATVGGSLPGIALLGAFVLGLFLSNGAVGVTVAFGFLGASRNFALYATVSLLTGVGGMAVGALLLTGRSGLLPSLFAG